MKTYSPICALSSLLLGALCVTPSFASASDTGAADVSIFDGQSLEGWHILQKPVGDKYHATEENFFAKDGALHCYQLPNKSGGLLMSDKEYGDFELTLEIKSDWGCDSGIFLRAKGGQGIQILNDYLQDGCVGYLFGQGSGGYISRPVRLYGQPDRAAADGVVARDFYDGVEKDGLIDSIDAAGWNQMWKHGEWNTLKVRCVGSEPFITTWVNGVKVMELDGRTYHGRHLKDEGKKNWAAPTTWDSEKVYSLSGGKGSIGFQVHPGNRWKPGGSAMYRNISIKEIDPSH